MIATLINRIQDFLQQKKVRLALYILSFLIVFSLLGSVLISNREILLNYDWQINPWALVATFITYTSGLLAIIFGWFLIMRSLVPKGSFPEHFRIYVVTNLAKRIPGPLWHIAGRYVLYQDLGISKTLVTVGSGLEAVILLISAIISYLLALALSSGDKNIEWGLVIILCLAIAAVHPKVVTFLLSRLKKQDDAPILRYRDLIAWLVFYIIGWSLGGATVFWLINVLTPLPMRQLPDVISVWTLAGAISSMIFFSPSGLGVQEITIVVLIGQLIPRPVAVIVAILLRVLLMSYQIVWAGLVLLGKARFWSKMGLILSKDY